MNSDVRESPKRGQLLRDFALSSVAGKAVSLADYRGRSSLVVVLLGDANQREGIDLLHHLARQHAQISESEAQVLAICACSRERAEAVKFREGLPFVVLADADAKVHCQLGVVSGQRVPTLAVYITDRFGEVFAAWSTAQRQAPPDAEEVLGWLEFISIQCPECFPPEWPAA